MSEQDLNNENEVEELTEEEGEETTGGAAGFGNECFECTTCGKISKTISDCVVHAHNKRHGAAIAWTDAGGGRKRAPSTGTAIVSHNPDGTTTVCLRGATWAYTNIGVVRLH